jgi:two-component system sensor histidine kinase/response regulator
MLSRILSPGHFRFSTKILLGSLGPFFLICLAMGGYMLSRIERDAMARLDEKGVATSRMLAKLSSIPILTNDHWVLNDYVTEISSDRDTVFAVVKGAKGRTLTTAGHNYEAEPSADVMFYSSPILNNGTQIGSVEIGISMLRFNAERRKDYFVFGLMSLGTMGLCIAFALSISSATTRPIHRMVQIMKTVEQGDFSVRQEVQGKDEIAVLARGFNDMLQQIGKRDHELEKYKQSLEAMVVKRTAELGHANRDLQRELAERRAVEDALRESEERMRGMFDSINAGIVLIDRDTRTIADLNPAALRMHGGDREEVIGQPCSHFFHPCRGENCPIRAEGQKMHQAERWLTCHNGVRLPILKSVNQVMVHGRPYLLESFVDLTEQVALKGQLLEAKESAEAANRAKSVFLANMSHEIRTPMNGVIGMIDLLLRAGLNEHQRHCAEKAYSSAQSLLKVLNDILDLSKIEAGKLQLDLRPMNLRTLVEGVAQLIAPQASEKGIEVIVNCQLDTPQWFVGDELRVRQVLTNLAGNAVKFTSRGHVLISARCDLLDGGPADIHLSVHDTGMGIAKEVQEGLFQPFVQADSSITRNFGGTGLGLTICEGLMEMMNGSIWVESEPDQGSVFHCTLSLPLFEKVEAHEEAKPKELTGVRVLVVDDNPVSSEALMAMLEDWRMQPMPAESWGSALEVLASKIGDSVSLLILDARMPEMDGFELLDRIRSQGRSTLPCVMMLPSGCSEEDASRCHALGLSSFLAKPICRAELQEAVLAAMGREPRLGSGASECIMSFDQGRSLRILLAEDNVVNQEVASGLLKAMGHQIQVASNGGLAVQAASESCFDLVLMDVQMPEVDGFEATRRIRTLDAERGQHTPIIAMTAHALSQDQQRCLDEGMDDYLSKPINSAQLAELIERWSSEDHKRPALASEDEPSNFGKAGVDCDAAARSPDGEASPVIDLPDFIRRCAGRAKLALRVLDKFYETTPDLMTKLEKSLQTHDFDEAARHAHSLRGAAANISAIALSQAAEVVECFCRDADKASSESHLDGVKAHFASCVSAMPEIRQQLEEFQSPAPGRQKG